MPRRKLARTVSKHSKPQPFVGIRHFPFQYQSKQALQSHYCASDRHTADLQRIHYSFNQARRSQHCRPRLHIAAYFADKRRGSRSVRQLNSRYLRHTANSEHLYRHNRSFQHTDSYRSSRTWYGDRRQSDDRRQQPRNHSGNVCDY